MQEQQFVQYTALKDLPKKEMSEKTLEEKAQEEKDHVEFMKSMGPQKIISVDGEKAENIYTKKSTMSNEIGAAQGAYLHDMAHDEDPKKLILKKIGSLDSMRLSGAQILVATYIRPERKKSGIILTAAVREEDQFQGKCGLVLKRGPLAYKSTDKLDFGGYEAKVGDWVWYRPMDGYALSVNGVHCRVLDDVEIKGDIDHPDLIV